MLWNPSPAPREGRGLLAVSLLVSASACAANPPAKATTPPDAASAAAGFRELADFRGESGECFDRQTQPHTLVVDSHLHFRPFGGQAVPYTKMLELMHQSGVLFANMYGIGQTLPVSGECTYYLDCPGTPVTPSLKHDFTNAANFFEYPSSDVHLTLSMAFPDLNDPAPISSHIELLEREYPDTFSWMGEVNLVKQALFDNGHQVTRVEAIDAWAPFMDALRERGIPIAIHADLGCDDNDHDDDSENNCHAAAEGQGDRRLQFLPLFEAVLERYPDNDIIWVHMGLSRELTMMDPVEHVRIISGLFERYPKLMLDISWTVLEEFYFGDPDIRAHYVALFNEHPTRVLTGTDFVASADKQPNAYAREVAQTSNILAYLDDEAFRRIALGQNYFDLLDLEFVAPQICAPPAPLQ